MPELTLQQIDEQLARLPELRQQQAAFDIETARLGNTPDRQTRAAEIDREIQSIEALHSARESLAITQTQEKPDAPVSRPKSHR